MDESKLIGSGDAQREKRQNLNSKSFVIWLLISCMVTSVFLCYYRPFKCPMLKHQVSFVHTPYKPEQLHLSLGQNDGEYYVTWSTQMPVNSNLIWHFNDSVVHHAKGELDDRELTGANVNEGFSIDGKYRKFTYRAKLQISDEALKKSSDEQVEVYCWYRVTSCQQDESKKCDIETKDSDFSSAEYKIRVKELSNSNRTVHLAFYGDLGLVNAKSIPRLTKEIDEYKFDLVIHNGDFAYDLNTHIGAYGDAFMRLIEPIAARVPYQTSVGNHEIAGNFSEYDHRFTMINRGPVDFGKLNNFFYSFDVGPVHFVGISTEFYYFLESVGVASLVNQYNWLKQDLAIASSPKARAERPWIVVFGHRPMYCSSRDNDDCSKDSNLLRKGLPFTGAYALEKLLYDAGVDVEMYSHEHQYERFLPIYNAKVYNGSFEKPYHNPEAPVHIISGSAGCQEKLDPFEGVPATGSVKQISDYGYTHLAASNCQLRFEQVSDDKDGTVVDQFVVTKDRQNFPIKSPSVTGRC